MAVPGGGRLGSEAGARPADRRGLSVFRPVRRGAPVPGGSQDHPGSTRSRRPPASHEIVMRSIDKKKNFEMDSAESIPIDGSLNLLKGIYNRVVKDFTHSPLSFELSTYVDAPPGSGLGTSSTLVVTVLGAFAEWLVRGRPRPEWHGIQRIADHLPAGAGLRSPAAKAR